MGIIGLGRIADLNVQAYLNNPDCEITAVCDINEALARKRAEEWNVSNVYTDYRKMLEDDVVDAVEILLPHDLHLDAVKAAAEAGKHISLQKPMARSLREAQEMIEVTRENGVLFRVTENFIYYPPYRKMRELIKNGEIGKPLSIRLRLGGGKGGWWVPLKNWVWKLDFQKSGGTPVIYDDGYHKLSLVKFLMGEIDSVRARISFPVGKIDAQAVIIWDHKNGATGAWGIGIGANLVMNWKYYGADEWVEVTGEKGVIISTRCTSRLMEIPPLIFYKDGTHTAFDHMDDDWSVSFINSGRDFISAIKEGRQPLLSGEDALYLMKFWYAIWKSYKTDKSVKIDEITEKDEELFK